MKRTAFIAVIVLSACVSVPALAHTEEILFRDIPWGSSYATVQQLLPDYDWYDMSFDYMRTYCVEEVLTDKQYGDGVVDFKNGGINMIARPFSDYEAKVAGYTTSDFNLYFAYVPIDGVLTKSDEDTAFYGARYDFAPQNLQEMKDDLTEKLTSLYEKPYEVTSTTDFLGIKTTYIRWSGLNNTYVVLRSEDASGCESDIFDDSLSIAYAWGEGDNLLAAADNAISDSVSNAEAENYGNGNTNGL